MPKHKLQLSGIILHPALCPNIFLYGKNNNFKYGAGIGRRCRGKILDELLAAYTNFCKTFV